METLEDAVSEIILKNKPDYLSDVYCRSNALTITDEYGPMTHIFRIEENGTISTDTKIKFWRFWGDFLQRRSHKQIEKMKDWKWEDEYKEEAEVTYEVNVLDTIWKRNTEKEALALAACYKYAQVYRITKEKIN